MIVVVSHGAKHFTSLCSENHHSTPCDVAREGSRYMHKASGGVSVQCCGGAQGIGWPRKELVRKGSPRGHFPRLKFGIFAQSPPHHQGEIRSYAPTVKGFWHLAGARRQTSARVFGSMFVWIHISWLIIKLEGNKHLLLRSRPSVVSSGG